MKTVTWVLRVLSTITFIFMAYNVYFILSGYWDWDAPYIFIVTVFRLLSLMVFFLVITVTSGLAAPFLGQQALNDLVVGLHNTLVLRMWYIQPYRVTGPLTNIFEVFASFQVNLIDLLLDLWNNGFTFLYFLFAALGVAFFLQSLFRMEHKFVGGAFISIQAILIVAAYREIFSVDSTLFTTDFVAFVISPLQILALISFAYLEISYQMIYSYSVGKPVEDRDETLKKQLLALRQATRKQDALERGEKLSTSAMSRSTTATALSFLREVIERKVIGSKDALEDLDAVSDVRRLQIYVDKLLASDPNAKDELTARAAAPSGSYVIGSTIMGSAIRFLSVVTISFFFLSPQLFIDLFSLPPGVAGSIELVQPEIVLIFLVPIVLSFVFVAMVIGWSSKREVEPKLADEEKKTLKRMENERKKKRKDAAKARKEREKARKAKKITGDEMDEWDRALEDAFKR